MKDCNDISIFPIINILNYCGRSLLYSVHLFSVYVIGTDRRPIRQKFYQHKYTKWL